MLAKLLIGLTLSLPGFATSRAEWQTYYKKEVRGLRHFEFSGKAEDASDYLGDLLGTASAARADLSDGELRELGIRFARAVGNLAFALPDTWDLKESNAEIVADLGKRLKILIFDEVLSTRSPAEQRLVLKHLNQRLFWIRTFALVGGVEHIHELQTPDNPRLARELIGDLRRRFKDCAPNLETFDGGGSTIEY